MTTDVCIIGAGAAGVTMAMAMANAPFSITLLESGGFDPEPDTQDLARGEVTGLPYFPLEAARLRCFGGSTQHWGGWCRPLDPVDFEARSWVPDSGWPIGRADLDEYYPRAQELCQLGEFDYEPAGWVLDDAPPLTLTSDRLTTRLIQFSPPARFGIRYRDAVLKAPNVNTYLHSNVVDIEASPGVRDIRHVAVRTLTGNTFSVAAKIFVLATGGIDNPRLLLASNKIARNGLGNDDDLVGRYFSDHMQLDTASVFPVNPDLPLGLYQLNSRDRLRKSRRPHGRSAPLMGYLALSSEVQRSARTLNYSANLLQSYWSDYFLHSNRPTIADDSWLRRSADALKTLWSNFNDAAAIAVGDHASGEKEVFYKIVTTQEQAPNRDSRVMLSTERDPLGVPRARVHWKFNELDRHTIRVAVDEITKTFGSAGIARLHVPNDLASGEWPAYLQGSWHHCGTTRMHANPKRGIVDANSRMHRITNMYIAGSSVFPTPGNGNPTLTVVALSLRLADHLKRQLA